jgi:hypothetical protein
MVVQELVGLLGFKTDQASVKQAQGSMDSLVAGVKVAVGAFMALGAVKWVQGAVNQVMQASNEIEKYSGRLGIATDQLQQLGYAAKMAGADFEVLAGGIQKMQVGQVEASKGNKGAIEKFKALGVEVKNADGTLKDAGQLVLDVADGIAQLKTDAEKTSASIKIFGGGAGGPLVGMMKKGSVGIREMSDEMNDFGAFMDSDLVQSSREYFKQQKRMAAGFLGIKIAIAKSLIPIISKNSKAFMDWWKVNGKIIRQRIGDTFEKLGKFLAGVVERGGKIVKFFWDLYNNLTPANKKLVDVTAGVLAFAKVLKMGIFKKWMIILILIALALEDINVFLEGGDSLLGRFLKKVQEWTGIDFAPMLREFAQALKVFSMSPEPFDWNMWGEEVTKVIDDYLKAAAVTWGEWWQTIKGWGDEFATWYNDLFTNNALSNFLGAALNLIIGLATSAGEVIGSFVGFLGAMWDNPKAAFLEFTKVFSDNLTILWENVKGFVDSVMNILQKPWDLLKDVGGAVGEFLGLTGKKTAPGPAITGARELLRGGAGAGFVPQVIPGGGSITNNGGGSYVNAPMSVNVSVQAAPGMSESRLANDTAQQVSREVGKQNRRTMQAFVPQKEAV